MALSYPLITNLRSHTRAQNAALNPGIKGVYPEKLSQKNSIWGHKNPVL